MNQSVGQDNKKYFRSTNPLLSKNNILFDVPFSCPLNMAFVGRHVPGRLAWSAITKNTHTGQTKVVSLDSGINIY